jgi:hypothetical protein
MTYVFWREMAYDSVYLSVPKFFNGNVNNILAFVLAIRHLFGTKELYTNPTADPIPCSSDILHTYPKKLSHLHY